MKKLLFGLLLVFGIGGAGIGLLILQVYNKTGPMVTTAENFFAALGAGDAATAQALGTEAFQEAADAAALAAYGARHELAGNDGITVNNRGFVDDSNGPDRGNLGGTILLADRTETVFAMDLVHDASADLWRVGKLEIGSLTPVPPARGELAKLVAASNWLLARALSVGEIAMFRDGTSRRWRESADAAEFEANFASLMPHASRLTRVFAQPPEVGAGATVSEGGVLEVEATYTTDEAIISTTHKYVREGIAWRLIGLLVRSKPR